MSEIHWEGEQSVLISVGPTTELTIDDYLPPQYSSPLLRLHFNISYEVCTGNVAVFPSGTQIVLGYHESSPRVIPFSTDINLFNDEFQVFERFSPNLMCLGVHSHSHLLLVSHIIREVRRYTSCVSMDWNEVMSFNVQIILEKVHYILFDEPDQLSLECGNQNYESDELNIVEVELSHEGDEGFDRSVTVENESVSEYRVENGPSLEFDGDDSESSSEYESTNGESDTSGSVDSETSYGDHEDDVYDQYELNNVLWQSSLEYEMGNYGMVPAAGDSVRRLARVKLEEEKTDKSCPICLDELVDTASALPCAHLFHVDCITEWLMVSHVCPLCRFEMPTDT